MLTNLRRALKHPDQRLRVGFVFSRLGLGGSATCIFNLARYLKSREFEVEMVVTEPDAGEWFELSRQLGFKTWQVPVGPKLLRGRRFHACSVGHALRQRNFDIVFLNHCVYAQRALGMLNEHTKVVTIPHGIQSVRFGKQPRMPRHAMPGSASVHGSSL